MKKYNKRSLVAGLLMTVLLAACGPDYIYHAEKEIPNATWTYRDSVVFEFEVQDTTLLYNLYFNIGALNDFASENLYVQLHTAFPDGKRLQKVQSFNVFDPQGQILGDKSGKGAQQHVMLQERTFFNQMGKYRIVVEQYMRQDSIQGIASLGLDVERTTQKK